jgi:hypothetical protein
MSKDIPRADVVMIEAPSSDRSYEFDLDGHAWVPGFFISMKDA